MNNKGILSYFCDMRDPRAANSSHHLEDIIFISIASIICGAENWHDIELYAQQKEKWLKTKLLLPHGIPSHDTFNRFFSALVPEEFENCFSNWVNDITSLIPEDVISIDGKTMRRTKGVNFGAAHIVSAWSDSNSMVLGQVKTEEKSNEITAIPLLLDKLLLDNCIVTIDAMGCQRKIARVITEKNADYILALKENQKELFRDTFDSFKLLKQAQVDTEIDIGHGRVEQRKCSVITDLSMLIDNIDNPWVNFNSIVRIDSERYHKSTKKTENETRYYISSLTDPKTINSAIRKHWGVENKLHWVLDMTFGEDYVRSRSLNAAENINRLNKICLGLIKKNKKGKSIRANRKMAGWNNKILEELMKI